jgi:2-oxoglutarate dehydrogenase E2 component (dihydrolipoamide succinyltransferase)
MGDVVIPRLNATDDVYVLVEWVAPTGAQVAEGDVVAMIETSKATTDLVASEKGYLEHRIAGQTECAPGQVVAVLTAIRPGTVDPAQERGPEPVSFPPPPPEPRSLPPAGPLLTRPAQELMREHGIPVQAVAALGRPVIRRTDVETLLAEGAPDAVGTPRSAGRPEPVSTEHPVLSPHQRAVARTVARSHATVPSAFLVMKISAEAVLRRQRELGETSRTFVGLPEQVITAVGVLHATFPRFYDAVADDLTLTPSPRADVGVTIDVGRGLLVPVVRDVAALEVTDVARRLMSLRAKAVRGRIGEPDLTGSAITMALHTDPGIVHARPVVFPGQVCTLSLTALQTELGLSNRGTPVARPFFCVGMAYDHRVVNGRDATRYLTALREELES